MQTLIRAKKTKPLDCFLADSCGRARTSCTKGDCPKPDESQIFYFGYLFQHHPKSHRFCLGGHLWVGFFVKSPKIMVPRPKSFTLARFGQKRPKNYFAAKKQNRSNFPLADTSGRTRVARPAGRLAMPAGRPKRKAGRSTSKAGRLPKARFLE